MSSPETPAKSPEPSEPGNGLPKGPSRDERGLYMRVDGAEFRTRDQLSKLNRDRLSKKGLKPIEIATFDDIRACNRDHLRTYCGVYEMKRKEKGEMELDMARYVAAWHYGEPGYDFAEYQRAKKVGAPPGNAVSTATRNAATRHPSVGQTPSQTTPSAGDKRPAPSAPAIDPNLLKTAAARPETRTVKRARVSTSGSTPRRRNPPSAQRAAGSLLPAIRAPGGVAAAGGPVPVLSGVSGIASSPPGPAPGSHVPVASAGVVAAPPSQAGNPGRTQPVLPGGVAVGGAAGAAYGTGSTPGMLAGAVGQFPVTRIAPATAVPPRAPVGAPGVPAAGLQGAPQYPQQRMIAVQPARAAAQPPPSAANSMALNAAASTSFKQYAHARQAAARYKAAYNGGGAAIVQVVENAASYFEGRDTSDAILDKKRCLERYQFNIDMLNQIFDGPPIARRAGGEDKFEGNASSEIDQECSARQSNLDGDGDTQMTGVTPDKRQGSGDSTHERASDPVSDAEQRRKNLTDGVLRRLADGMLGRSDDERIAALTEMDKKFEDLLERDEGVDRMHVRALQALDKAQTVEEVERVRRDFEKQHNIRFVEGGSTIVRRELAKDAPLFVPPAPLRILKLG